MRFLVLGGTRFLGRHLVDAAIERGHTVTTFTRGQSPTHEHPSVLPLGGDRDPDKGRGLAALASATWDAVFDTSGYVPRIVGASCDLLESRVRRYLFVSSLSVYEDTSRPGVTEDAPRARLDDPATEDVTQHYGALKAACEDRVVATYGERATVIRPGLIVGPHDPTDRFTYWVARFTQSQALGERDDEAAVPAPPDRPIQLIDARDLAQWMITLAERDVAGTYNAISPPGRWTMADLVEALQNHPSRDHEPPSPVWIDPPVLKNAGIEPWTELPLWLPQDDPQFGGFFLVDDKRARDTGLVARALSATVGDTAAWLAGRWRPDAWQHVLTVERERRLLALQSER
ncbi:MAG: NAD-dependent epimerase/dehydratase family protein [Betaproteobacteria bacterium]